MVQMIDSPGTASRKAAMLLAALLGLSLLSSVPGSSAPMRCSGEQKTCMANCSKSRDRSSISICLTNCGMRQSACLKTGCWDSGPQRYCGLLKQ
jgi:hypothetical protein